MRLGIDASNLRAGGTTTHLIELLRVARPRDFGFEEVIVWAGSAVLARIEPRDWLVKKAEPLLEQHPNPFRDRRHVQRAYWQRFRLRRLAESAGCDVLLVPGGMDNSGFRPFVTMSRNMLPFDPGEARRYGWSLSRLRLWLLRRLQIRTFRRADGLIFLTAYAQAMVSKVAGLRDSTSIVVPHGVSSLFSIPPRPQKRTEHFSAANPLKLLYVSTVDTYKHQWHVVDAVARLRSGGIPITLDLVGPGYGAGLRKLMDKLASTPNSAEFVHYRGAVPYESLRALYERADLKVFASSCENMPNILLEAMAAGLPIACSRCGPMPEVLQDAGIYFDPENSAEIAAAIEELVRSPQLRERNAARAVELARQYSWERCAAATFGYLESVARNFRVARTDV